MTDMLAVVVTILAAIAVATVLYFVLKRSTMLLLNSVVGVVVLFALDWLHVLSPGVPITLGAVLVCAFGGLPGVVALVALHLLGFDV
ncbi:MAG: pro-sigmaK processing inhibitor BofA family protein [Methanospirillum sp.]